MKKISGSEYINEQRREYSLYVMQMRAIPAVTDGLKAAGRRVLWIARDGKRVKSATLAGATMPIHPHASPEGAINTLAAPYGNNIPLFKGDGAFGTLLNPTAYGASRYTSVTTSKFTQDVVFQDIEIIPMQENYDGTLLEPIHFLPLIPLALLNPSEGIAVGYATNILPRSLEDIIVSQIAHLKGAKNLSDPTPKFLPIQNFSFKSEATERGVAYYFEGEIEQLDATNLRIKTLPYGLLHSDLIKHLEKLFEQGVIVDYIDKSKKTIDITVKFKKGGLKDMTRESMLKTLSLVNRHIENLNVLDFSGKAIWHTTAISLIQAFTDWRLTWYGKRYQRLLDLLNKELQRYKDIITAIDNNVGGIAKKILDKQELEDFLKEINIVDIDYISSLPVYRFTKDEYIKTKTLIQETLHIHKEYVEIINDPIKQQKIYIQELETILKTYNKGNYNE